MDIVPLCLISLSNGEGASKCVQLWEEFVQNQTKKNLSHNQTDVFSLFL